MSMLALKAFTKYRQNKWPGSYVPVIYGQNPFVQEQYVIINLFVKANLELFMSVTEQSSKYTNITAPALYTHNDSRSLSLSLSLSHTHTHTHTQRGREQCSTGNSREQWLLISWVYTHSLLQFCTLDQSMKVSLTSPAFLYEDLGLLLLNALYLLLFCSQRSNYMVNNEVQTM
jgi:hypothetical protein